MTELKCPCYGLDSQDSIPNGSIMTSLSITMFRVYPIPYTTHVSSSFPTGQISTYLHLIPRLKMHALLPPCSYAASTHSTWNRNNIICTFISMFYYGDHILVHNSWTNSFLYCTSLQYI